ncbi:hypothetical protein EHQ46_05925 [Leptospira yanagawae]|uniref:Lipoprotein n=1 Tax=Leptospira yanagawae TaxID=293069 RepID=A0ABY2M3I5_9LEPT|nr:hypothetical protein [Leptospira yanagawae]TGL23053.1 hypothetical protein EHQ46_05925 [Leptospira yanagawae]
MKTKLIFASFILITSCFPLENQDTLPIIALAIAASASTDYRSVDEPNDSFESAVCKDEPFELYLFPSSDIDYYKFSIQNTNLKLYILKKESFGIDNNFNFQILNNSNQIIYDVNNIVFDSLTADIITNRNMSQSDCGVFTLNCVGLENLRFIEFQNSLRDFVLKFSVKDQLLYEENKNQPRKINLPLNVSRNISNSQKSILVDQGSLVFFEGVSKKCSE